MLEQKREELEKKQHSEGIVSTDRNLVAKKQMAKDLLSLGLSREAVARVLNLKINSEVLERP